jgi:hypothetical protein
MEDQAYCNVHMPSLRFKRTPTQLSVAGNNLIIPGHREFGELHPGWRWENRKPFLQCIIHKKGLLLGGFSDSLTDRKTAVQ